MARGLYSLWPFPSSLFECCSWQALSKNCSNKLMGNLRNCRTKLSKPGLQSFVLCRFFFMRLKFFQLIFSSFTTWYIFCYWFILSLHQEVTCLGAIGQVCNPAEVICLFLQPSQPQTCSDSPCLPQSQLHRYVPPYTTLLGEIFSNFSVLFCVTRLQLGRRGSSVSVLAYASRLDRRVKGLMPGWLLSKTLSQINKIRTTATKP